MLLLQLASWPLLEPLLFCWNLLHFYFLLEWPFIQIILELPILTTIRVYSTMKRTELYLYVVERNFWSMILKVTLFPMMQRSPENIFHSVWHLLFSTVHFCIFLYQSTSRIKNPWLLKRGVFLVPLVLIVPIGNSF